MSRLLAQISRFDGTYLGREGCSKRRTIAAILPHQQESIT